MKSKTVFIVDNISMCLERSEHIVKIKCELKTRIDFRCSTTNETFREINFTTHSSGFSETECLKEVIQNFLDNYKTESNISYHDVNVDSTSISGKIDEVEVLVPDPLKSLFYDLFDSSKWQLQKNMLTNRP